MESDTEDQVLFLMLALVAWFTLQTLILSLLKQYAQLTLYIASLNCSIAPVI